VHALRAAAALALLAAPLAALSSTEATAAYDALWRGRFAARGVAVPAGGLSLSSDVASWRLLDGEIRGMEPLADGTVAGCVFRGRGRFAMALPDSRERASFARLGEAAERDPVELDFEELVVRSADGTCERLAGRPAGPFAPDALAEERRRIWIERAFFDVEAAIVRALVGDAPGLLVAEMSTREHGWLLYTFDPDLREEIGLAAYHPSERVYESWVSLDRADDRRPDGRAGPRLGRQFDLVDVGIRADLRRPSKYSKAGRGQIMPRRGRFEATLRFRPLRPELRSLALELDVFGEPVEVRDEAGRRLAFLRDHVGARSGAFREEAWDDNWLVLLDEPVGEEERSLTFAWERDILNYVSGRQWYPGERDGYRDPHTATLEVLALPKHDVRAMGTLVEERDDDSGRRASWRVERPVRVVTFAFAERFEEARIDRATPPDVVAFRARGGAQAKAHNVGADVANAWSYFEHLFGPGPATEVIYATAIVGGHGQAFEGFLHLAEESFEVESPGRTEMFRAHETAHQWWGHLVGWDSSRDLWLSEGFAQFSALLFVEATVKNGPELYREAIESYAAAALGESKPSRMLRGFSPPANPKQWRRVGPIALGTRASTAEVGSGYAIQAYYKGTLVLHMLRCLLRERSGDDRLLLAVLADFAREFRGREASTGDFAAVLARHAPGDWEWFFRQWIDETAIPSWEWTWRRTKGEDGGEAVEVELAQSGAPPGFRCPVPVAVRLAGGEAARAVVLVDEPRERWTIPLPRRAEDVELDPDRAVLARRREH
jgi:hypothetical protein